jgi:hypothetical protein
MKIFRYSKLGSGFILLGLGIMAILIKPLSESGPSTPEIQKQSRKFFSETELEVFLDSVGSLETPILAAPLAQYTDSVFSNRQPLNREILPADYDSLMALSQREELFRFLDTATAKRIFGPLNIDSAYWVDNAIPLYFYWFSESGIERPQFALSLGAYPSMSRSTELFFFAGPKIIARLDIYHRYGLEIDSYLDATGARVIYYKQNFISGTGIWQFNYFFYRYTGGQLIPILQELENGNLNGWGRPRYFWLKADIIKTQPLTLKMVYHQELVDSTGSIKLLDDSTLVRYFWDPKAQMLKGQFEESKIKPEQILSYYPADNELLFVNSHYQELKAGLRDSLKRPFILSYLRWLIAD